MKAFSKLAVRLVQLCRTSTGSSWKIHISYYSQWSHRLATCAVLYAFYRFPVPFPCPCPAQWSWVGIQQMWTTRWTNSLHQLLPPWSRVNFVRGKNEQANPWIWPFVLSVGQKQWGKQPLGPKFNISFIHIWRNDEYCCLVSGILFRRASEPPETDKTQDHLMQVSPAFGEKNNWKENSWCARRRDARIGQICRGVGITTICTPFFLKTPANQEKQWRWVCYQKPGWGHIGNR